MTTERVLPAIALPLPGRAARERSETEAARRRQPAAHAAKRNEPLLTTPARAGMLIGASAAVYAVTLAGISGLQSAADSATIARREPWLEQVAQSRAANDELQAALDAANAESRALAADYARAGGDLAEYEARLDALAALVTEVRGTAASLPDRISLPKVTVRSTARSSRPSTSGTTGASGG